MTGDQAFLLGALVGSAIGVFGAATFRRLTASALSRLREWLRPLL